MTNRTSEDHIRLISILKNNPQTSTRGLANTYKISWSIIATYYMVELRRIKNANNQTLPIIPQLPYPDYIPIPDTLPGNPVDNDFEED